MGSDEREDNRPTRYGESDVQAPEDTVQHRVEHQQARRRFVLAVEGKEAELTYRRAGDRIIFDHTGVPPEFQHQGLANRLAEAGLAFAREHKLRVEPMCRFMEVYIKRHPEHQDLVSPD